MIQTVKYDGAQGGGAEPAKGPQLRELPPPEPNLLAELNETRAALEQEKARSEERLKQLNGLKERVGEWERNPFLFTMNHLDAGQVLEEAGLKLREVTKAVSDLGGKGAVTLSLELKRYEGKALAVVVTPTLKVKKPEPKAETALFYPTEDGNLQRNDPRQKDFDF